jgi:uncharacterized membrane protein YecN with MAPEG domain
MITDTTTDPYPMRRWFRVRADSIRWITLGSLSWPLVAAAAWFLWPDVAPIDAPMDRLVYAVKLIALPALVVAVAVIFCLRLFDAEGAEDPFSGSESHRFAINSRVLTNTAEQTLIFIPMLLALSVSIDPADTRVLPIATALWVTGRILFWAGYHMNSNWRAVGFDWTFYTSLLGLAWVAVAAIW